jgi:hypothetical protein
MANQVNYVTFFSTEGVDSPNPLFRQKDLTETPMLRVMQVFSHLESNLVPVKGAPGAVSVYGTEGNNHASASLFFVNQSKSSQHISVRGESILPWSPWHGLQAWSWWQDASLTLPGYSMAVLTLHRNGSDEVFTFNNSVSAQHGAPPVYHVVCSSGAC